VSTNHPSIHPSISLSLCAGRWCCTAALLHVRCFHSVCPFAFIKVLPEQLHHCAAVAPVSNFFSHMLSNCGLVIIGFNHATSRLVTLQVSSVSTPLLSLLLWKTIYANLCRRDLWFSSEIFCFILSWVRSEND
jgi:hypothetical protein